jgi:phage-related protein
MQAHCLRIIEIIERKGLQVISMPFIKSLGSKLWEIRFKGQDGIARAIYVHDKEKRLVIVHVFIKKSQATPKQAIEIAKKRAKEVKL